MIRTFCFVMINKFSSKCFEVGLSIIIKYKDIPIHNIFRGVILNSPNGAQWSIQRNFIKHRGIMTPCTNLFGSAQDFSLILTRPTFKTL